MASTSPYHTTSEECKHMREPVNLSALSVPSRHSLIPLFTFSSRWQSLLYSQISSDYLHLWYCWCHRQPVWQTKRILWRYDVSASAWSAPVHYIHMHVQNLWSAVTAWESRIFESLNFCHCWRWHLLQDWPAFLSPLYLCNSLLRITFSSIAITLTRRRVQLFF